MNKSAQNPVKSTKLTQSERTTLISYKTIKGVAVHSCAYTKENKFKIKSKQEQVLLKSPTFRYLIPSSGTCRVQMTK